MRSLKRIFPALLLLGCALLFPSAEARADAIEITSGVFAASNPTPFGRAWRSWGYDLRGDGFRITGSEPDGSRQNVQTVGCFQCQPGDNFYINHPAGLFVPIPTQFVQFNGESHTGWASGILNFATDPFVIPPSGGDLITLTGHFTMTGSVSFDPFIVVNPVDLPPFVVGDVYGSGIVTLQFTRLFGSYQLTNVRYEFQPTPEPATLVLLGSGIAGLAARHRRRRSRRRKSAITN